MFDEQLGEHLHPLPRLAALPLERVPIRRDRRGPRRVVSDRAGGDKVVVHAAALDERTQHTDQEREVASGVNVEPVIAEVGAQDRAREH
jgi:hypothetical protein